MTAERIPTRLPVAPDLAPDPAEPTSTRRPARPSTTRSTSLSRVARVRGARRGNVNSLTHGVRSVVQAAPDVSIEIALTLEMYPGLDPIADRRDVEHLAQTRVSRQRALLAMQTEGLTAVLTGYDVRLSMLEERLSRDLRIAERRRIADRAKADPDPLARYRPGASS